MCDDSSGARRSRRCNARMEKHRRSPRRVRALKRPEGRAPVCRARPARPQAWCRTQQQRRKRGAGPLVLAALAAQLEAATLADADAPMRSAQRTGTIA